MLLLGNIGQAIVRHASTGRPSRRSQLSPQVWLESFLECRPPSLERRGGASFESGWTAETALLQQWTRLLPSDRPIQIRSAIIGRYLWRPPSKEIACAQNSVTLHGPPQQRRSKRSDRSQASSVDSPSTRVRTAVVGTSPHIASVENGEGFNPRRKSTRPAPRGPSPRLNVRQRFSVGGRR